MSRKVKIGIIQQHSVLGDVKKNIEKAVEMIDDLGNQGADIICLPELFATGYNLEYLGGIKTLDLIREHNKYIEESMSEAAKRNNVYLISPYGTLEKDSTHVFNSAVIFDRQGNMMGEYCKNHLWSLEAVYFKAGEKIDVYDADFGKFGVMICYDAGFPEVARELMLKGSEIIFIPSAWRIQDEDMWDLNVSQRALENTVYTVGVNLVSNDPNLILFGKSKICNPRGTIISQLDTYREKYILAEIDLDEIEKYRNDIPYLKDRKNSYNI
ncbi:carbon-nitrogen hydrolase [Clostridioides difficile]|nr:carbon-nitrogen hydrolase [Clostridioides difficile]